MCFDIKTSLESQLKKARKDGDTSSIREIEEKLFPLLDTPGYHLSAFNHPKLLLYTQNNIKVSYWGLIPAWVKDRKSIPDIWNKTLLARIESLTEKASFKASAFKKRSILYVDGFYEYHHFKGKSYPFFIQNKANKPLAIACIWNEWFDHKTQKNIHTFAIVTTKANTLMTKIHNNPKLKEARMPFLLNTEEEHTWLQDLDQSVEKLQAFVSNFPSKKLMTFPVQKLRGKNYLGNVKEAAEEYIYPELEYHF